MIRRVSVPPTPEAVIEQIRRSFHDGKDREEIWGEMRALGMNITRSMLLTSQLYGMSLTDAKIAVHYSDAWADMRAIHDEFHENAFAAAKELGFEEVEAKTLSAAS